MKQENNNRPFLNHYKPHAYQKYMLYSLIFLLAYGFYKNGVLPILNQDASFIALLRILIYPIGGYLLGKSVEKYGKVPNDFYSYYGLLIGMSMPIQLNEIIFLLILSLLFWGGQFLQLKLKKLSPLLLTRGIFSIIILINSISYLNPSEIHQPMIYTTLDIFFGRNSGGLYTTSIFWLGITFLILCFNDLYKKEIPIFSCGTYVILALLFEVIYPTGNVLPLILNSSVIFGSLFLAAEIVSAPYLERSKQIYGIMIGMMGFLFVRFVNAEEGIYLSIAICSFFAPLLDKWLYKREKKRNFVDSLKPKKTISRDYLPKLKQM